MLNGSSEVPRDVVIATSVGTVCYNWLFGFLLAITGCVIASNTHLILGVDFGVELSNEDIAEIECLRVIAMEINFRTKIAISSFV